MNLSSVPEYTPWRDAILLLDEAESVATRSFRRLLNGERVHEAAIDYVNGNVRNFGNTIFNLGCSGEVPEVAETCLPGYRVTFNMMIGGVVGVSKNFDANYDTTGMIKESSAEADPEFMNNFSEMLIQLKKGTFRRGYSAFAGLAESAAANGCIGTIGDALDLTRSEDFFPKLRKKELESLEGVVLSP